jgi:predicted aminopeptidase
MRKWRLPRRRTVILSVLIAGGAAVLAFGAAVVLSADVRFILRGAYEESRILLGRRSLEELIADSATSEGRRAQFELVLAARHYAADSLDLEAKETYTTFTDIGRDTLLLVLTASPRHEFAAYTWRYPIVGTVPYKGFFDLDGARAEARRLEEQGYDVHLRPAPAFSTLGWFNDPLLSTALSEDPVLLANLVFHEIAHNTLYVAGATPFDESFALFVGYRAAEAFFAGRGDSVNARRAAAIWRDQRRLGAFYRELVDELEALYEEGLPLEEVLQRREVIFQAARERLRGALGRELEAYRGESLARRQLNNASLLGQRIYRSQLALFDSLLVLQGGDVKQAVAVLEEAVAVREDVEPFEVLAALVGG